MQVTVAAQPTNEYDRVIQECLADPVCAATLSAPNQRDDLISIVPWVIVGLIACALIVLALRFRATIAAAVRAKRRPLLKVLSAYAVWALCVLTYLALDQPFGEVVFLEPFSSLASWLLLPPLCVAAVSTWVSKFLRDR